MTKSSAEMTPWAMLPMSAAWSPVSVPEARPRTTKPMCATDEKAMSRLRSRSTRQMRPPQRMPTTPAIARTGAIRANPSGTLASGSRTRP